MEKNETRKGKYSKKILKEKEFPKMNKPNKEQKIRKNKLIKLHSGRRSRAPRGGLHSGLRPRAPTSYNRLYEGHTDGSATTE
jgi:hypothetical protein